MLIVHIAIALASLIAATYALVRSSRRSLNASYALMALTLATGTYMAVALQASLLHVCLSGITYLAVAFVLTAAASSKLSLSSK